MGKNIGNLDFHAIFKKNLKYISQTEISAECIERQFVKTHSRFHLKIGNIDCPTGQIIVADPLCFLSRGEICPQLAMKIPPGVYPVEISVLRNEDIGVRICTARLKFKKTKACSYICAEPTPETAAAELSDGILTGFPVEAGLFSFCDLQVANEYRIFLGDWRKTNPGKNFYDDYFAELFRKSAEELPAFQRSDGDFIVWKNPETNRRLTMIASGFGDGFYQSFWGYDIQNEPCELIVPLINPDIIESGADF